MPTITNFSCLYFLRTNFFPRFSFYLTYKPKIVVICCDCIVYKIEYDYGGDLSCCIQCFEKKDPLTNLYRYFKEKYNETMTLQDIEK